MYLLCYLIFGQINSSVNVIMWHFIDPFEDLFCHLPCLHMEVRGQGLVVAQQSLSWKGFTVLLKDTLSRVDAY